MENAPDALHLDLYVEEKKREAVALYFRRNRESGWIRSLSQVGGKSDVRQDIAYIPWSNKGKGKDSKDKGYKGGGKKGDKGGWHNQQGGKGEEAAQPPVEEVSHLSATAVDETWIYSVLAEDKIEEETPSGGDTPRDGIDQTIRVTDELESETIDKTYLSYGEKDG
eukprot:5870407-Amphidinium_carterae.4